MLALLIVVLAVFEYVMPWLGVSGFLAPKPSAVGEELVQQLGTDTFWEHTRVTLIEVFGGLLIGGATGFLLGLLLSQSRVLEILLTPYIVGLQAVPKVALAPLIVVGVGFGVWSKIVLAAVIAFFPVLVNVMVGVRSVEQERLDLMCQLRATRWQTLRWLVLPASLPFIMAGLRIAATFAVIGAIVGEFTGASSGLGALLLQYNFNFNQAGVFAVLVWLSAIAVVIDLALRAATKRFVFWQQGGDATNSGVA